MGEIVRYDKTQQSLKEGMSVLARRMADLDLSAPGIEFTITRLANKAQYARDLAKDRRRREMQHHEAAIKEIRGRWDDIVFGFDRLFGQLKVTAQRVLVRQQEDAAKKRAEAQARLDEARRKQLAEERKKNPSQMKETLTELRKARKVMDSLPRDGAPIGVKVEEGTLFQRQLWKFQVEDISQVPDSYVQRMVVPEKVELAIRNGVRTIPGIRIYPEAEMAVRRRRA